MLKLHLKEMNHFLTIEGKALGEAERREGDICFQISGKAARTNTSWWEPRNVHEV